MLYKNREDRRRELFLRQFYHTAQIVFIGRKSGWRQDAGKKLIELARPALGVPNDVPPFTIYARLAYVWRTMNKRSKTWNRNIDLMPIDFGSE